MAKFTGTNAADNINGTKGADQIFGLGGNDNLVGLDGDDVIEGGAGGDGIFGSVGFDYASYRSSPVGVYVSLTDLIGHYGHAEGDQLYGIEGVIGSKYRDLMTGGEQGDVFYGEGGADHLGGLDGNDKLYGGGGNDLLEGGFGDDDLYGGAGNDTASLYNYGSGVVADLASRTATGTTTGHDRLFEIENLVGTPYADRLAGDGRANVLNGSFDSDLLTGRGGADRFDYNQTSDSPSTSPDHITDFSRSQGDRIDLRDVDGNQRIDGVQDLTFIGKAAFTAVGQLHFYQSGGHTYIEANTSDTTPGAELVIVLDQSIAMKAGDFLL
ncbi:MAG: M10 family metallopeptidase C-terminal domain-containing protein [Geminicoccaceae bacterium]